MKGLIRKELYLVWKNFRFYFIISLGFLFLGVWSDNSFFFAYPALMGSMVPINLLSFDEKSGWDRYSAVFPLTRGQLVSSKYLTSLICSGFMLLLCALFALAKIFVVSHDVGSLRVLLPMLLVLMLLPAAVAFPCILKFGPQKGSLFYFLVFAAIFVAIFAMFQIMGFSNFDSIPSLIRILPLVSAVLFGLSWLLSVAIYKKKSF